MQLPSPEEMAFLLKDQKMTTIVYFLDETFDEMMYDMATTVMEAVEQLAGIIKLQNYSTFTLFESRKVNASIFVPCSTCHELHGMHTL